MSLTGIRLRSQVIAATRSFLSRQGFQEFEPQLLKPTQPLEPAIYPFQTQWDRLSKPPQTLYMATSPEGYLKQVLAAGQPTCFAISHAARNLEGEGPLHQPEFVMVEWYKKQADWQAMMNLTQELVSTIWQTFNPKTAPDCKPWPTFSLKTLWQTHLHTDLDDFLTDSALKSSARSLKLNVVAATWEQLFYQIVFNFLEPHFSKQPFFLIDFPSRISPLAKPQSSNQNYCERFELFINKIELANGNTENTNVPSIKAVMNAEQKARSIHTSKPPIDTDFLTSVKKMTKYQYAGVGLGLDRLTMLIGNINDIQAVQWP
jgi:elongation factor P--beta-lysine ligase